MSLKMFKSCWFILKENCIQSKNTNLVPQFHVLQFVPGTY